VLSLSLLCWGPLAGASQACGSLACCLALFGMPSLFGRPARPALHAHDVLHVPAFGRCHYAVMMQPFWFKGVFVRAWYLTDGRVKQAALPKQALAGMRAHCICPRLQQLCRSSIATTGGQWSLVGHSWHSSSYSRLEAGTGPYLSLASPCAQRVHLVAASEFGSCDSACLACSGSFDRQTSHSKVSDGHCTCPGASAQQGRRSVSCTFCMLTYCTCAAPLSLRCDLPWQGLRNWVKVILFCQGLRLAQGTTGFPLELQPGDAGTCVILAFPQGCTVQHAAGRSS
jgi:hypothetical protein